MVLFKLKNVGLILLLICLALPTPAAEITLPALTLPAPTGQFKVGTTYMNFTDKSRPETLTKDEKDFRQLEVQIWYPAAPNKENKIAGYWRLANIIGPAVVKSMFSGLPKSLGTIPDSGMHKVANSKTHAYLDAPLSTSWGKYPVLIFSHGYEGLASQNTAQLQELASHGYIVFSIGHTYEASIVILKGDKPVRHADAPELAAANDADKRTIGPLYMKMMGATSNEEKMKLYKQMCGKAKQSEKGLNRWAADIKFMVNQLSKLNEKSKRFKGYIDLEKIGTIGHSFGGGAAAQACYEDKRIKACIIMDYMQMGTWHFDNKLNNPIMHMRSEDAAKFVTPTIYNNADSPSYLITIKGTKHYNFSDMALFPSFFKDLGFLGSIDGERGIIIYSQMSLAFFDKHLKGMDPRLLFNPSREYPEVIYKTRNVTD